jgi:hypothetical protein
MPTPEITDQQIADAAVAPQSVSVDGVTMTNRPLKDLIDAQDDLNNNANAQKPRRGVLFSRMIPGSARGQ